MKRFFPLFVFILFPLAVFSKEIKTLNARDVENENFSYDNTILELKDVSEPLEKGNHIIFTAKHNVRFVGIAFDFEEYKKIHPFKIHSTYDIDNNKTGSLMFYVLAKPKGVSSVSYRLIVDGIWTTDPTNPDSYFDENLGLQLSRINFSTTIQSEINSSANKNGTHFVYEGRPGQKIYVSGTFSNWDPWIYEMKETMPGFYEIHIPLSRGTYYYNFFAGLKTFTDRTNPRKVYTKDGRSASVITIE